MMALGPRLGAARLAAGPAPNPPPIAPYSSSVRPLHRHHQPHDGARHRPVPARRPRPGVYPARIFLLVE